MARVAQGRDRALCTNLPVDTDEVYEELRRLSQEWQRSECLLEHAWKDWPTYLPALDDLQLYVIPRLHAATSEQR